MDYALRNLGFETIIEGADTEEGFVYYYHEALPLHPPIFDFSDGPIPWWYVEFSLEWAGVDVNALRAQIEAM